MSKTHNLAIILAEGEGYYTELKESINKLDKELVAFANVSGGKVLLGVRDDGSVKGFSLDKKSVTRNPLIAAMLLRLGYIEKLGTGINRIQTALKNANAPLATFDAGSFFSVIFPRLDESVGETSGKNVGEKVKKASGKNQKNTENTLIKNEKNTKSVSEKNVGETSGKNVGENIEDIVVLIKKNPQITIAEMAQAVGVTTRTIERKLKQLQQQSRIKRIGPDKGGFWQLIKQKKK